MMYLPYMFISISVVVEAKDKAFDKLCLNLVATCLRLGIIDLCIVVIGRRLLIIGVPSEGQHVEVATISAMHLY